MSNNLAVRQQTNVSAWEDQDRAAGLMELAMDVFNVATEDRNRNDVQNAVQAAITRCLTYGLLPGRDVWLLPFSQSYKDDRGQWQKKMNYVVDTGLLSWQKFADKQMRAGWMEEYIEMTEVEVKAELGDKYVSGCIGWRCRVWDISKSDFMERRGITPPWYAGFYLVEMRFAKGGSKVATPENIPAHRTTHDVAKRRALKFALTRTTSECWVGDLGNDPEKGLKNALMDAKAEQQERKRIPMASESAMIMDGDRFYEDDDGMTWAGDEPDASFRAVDNSTGEIVNVVEGLVKEGWGAVADTAEAALEDMVDGIIADIADGNIAGDNTRQDGLADIVFEGNTGKFIDACRREGAFSDGYCTKPQYGFLKSVIIGIGSEETHHDILHVLAGRQVDSENLPPFGLAKYLLDVLPAEKGKKGDKVKNTDARHPGAVAAVKEIHAKLSA